MRHTSDIDLVALSWCTNCGDWFVGEKHSYLWNDIDRMWYHAIAITMDMLATSDGNIHCGPVEIAGGWR